MAREHKLEAVGLKVQVKVKVTLEQATKAQRGARGIGKGVEKSERGMGRSARKHVHFHYLMLILRKLQ